MQFPHNQCCNRWRCRGTATRATARRARCPSPTPWPSCPTGTSSSSWGPSSWRRPPWRWPRSPPRRRTRTGDRSWECRNSFPSRCNNRVKVMDILGTVGTPLVTGPSDIKLLWRTGCWWNYEIREDAIFPCSQLQSSHKNNNGIKVFL